MANSTMTTTSLQYHIPEVWANKVLGALPAYLNLARTVSRDYEDEVANFGDTINIAKRGTLSANDKVEGNDVTIQTPSDSTVQVTLSNHKEITFSPSDVARAFAKPDVMAGHITDAVVAIGEAVESSLTALYVDVATGNDLNAGDSVGIDDLRAARRRLVTQKVNPMEPIFGYLDEFAVEDLPLTDASALGKADPVAEGSIAKLGGVNIFESQVVATSDSASVYHPLVYSRDAITLVARPLPRDAEVFGGAKQTTVFDPRTGLNLRVTMSYNANALAPQVTIDVLWGVKVIRPEHLIDLYHTNA